ncbi:MAG: helix-turn-helix domain-containing protein [Pedobacter sp.]|jgi:chromosomal replication initiator protein
MNYYIFPGLDKKVQRRFLIGEVNSIINVTCSLFNVDPEDVISTNRKRIYTEPRQIAMYFIRNKTNLSFAKIGKIFSDRDHSTVHYSVDLVKDMIDINKRFRKKIEELEKLI